MADDLNDALNGYYLPILDTGSGTFSVRSALGAYYGTNEHVLSIGELAAHTHTYVNNNVSPPKNFQVNPGTNYGEDVTQNTSSTGDSLPHNITQPTSFTNVFIKL